MVPLASVHITVGFEAGSSAVADKAVMFVLLAIVEFVWFSVLCKTVPGLD